MGTSGGSTGEEPLLQPRLVRFLKKRNRLIDLGFREEFLDQLDAQLSVRRTPSHVAEKTANSAMERAREAGVPVVRDRVRSRAEKANSGIAEKL